MTVEELLKKMADEKEKLNKQINLLEEQELNATLNDDDRTYFSIAFELGDLEYDYEQLVNAIDIVKYFMREEIK